MRAGNGLSLKDGDKAFRSESFYVVLNPAPCPVYGVQQCMGKASHEQEWVGPFASVAQLTSHPWPGCCDACAGVVYGRGDPEERCFTS